MSFTTEQIEAGYSIYTKRVLRSYDFVVHGVSNRFVWRCPTQHIVDLYNRHVTANHLDVGVGTGYFLDKCRFPASTPRVALVDLNQNTLDFTSRRIARYRPKTYLRNVLKPISIDGANFDSVAASYLLHCLPGSIEDKVVALDHLGALMNPGAVIFGSTFLQGGVRRSWFAKRLMEVYNRKGIFSNRHDTLVGLRQALEGRFEDVEIAVYGCAALFIAHV